jgi:hypothetical protein
MLVGVLSSSLPSTIPIFSIAYWIVFVFWVKISKMLLVLSSTRFQDFFKKESTCALLSYKIS